MRNELRIDSMSVSWCICRHTGPVAAGKPVPGTPITKRPNASPQILMLGVEERAGREPPDLVF